jgi:hypothetical protein
MEAYFSLTLAGRERLLYSTQLAAAFALKIPRKVYQQNAVDQLHNIRKEAFWCHLPALLHRPFSGCGHPSFTECIFSCHHFYFILGQMLRPLIVRSLANPCAIALAKDRANQTIVYVCEMDRNRVIRFVQNPPGVYHPTVFLQLAGRMGSGTPLCHTYISSDSLSLCFSFDSGRLPYVVMPTDSYTLRSMNF